MRISNSFSEGEIQVLDFILSTLLRGGSPNMAIRSKDFASLCRKVQTMKSRMGEVTVGENTAKGEVKAAKSAVNAIAPENASGGSEEDLESTG